MTDATSPSNIVPLRTPVPKEPFAKLSNLEAEHGLLGALLVNNAIYEHIVDVIAPEDFSYAIHGRIFSALSKLIESGTVANPITLKGLFDETGALEEIGGLKYITKLATHATLASNAPNYAKVINDLSRRRALIYASQDTIADAASPRADRDADTVADEAEQRLFLLSDRARATGAEKVGVISDRAFRNTVDAYNAGGAVVIDTGLSDLDKIISGLSLGDLCVLGARVSQGKSALAATVALNAARAGKPVAFFSLEMTKEELAQRWLASITGICTDDQRHGKLDAGSWAALDSAQKSLEPLPLFVDDQPRLSVAQIRQRSRRIKRRAGLSLIIIDHLQIIRGSGKHDNRVVELSEITSTLKAVAKEINVPILLLSQINRGVEGRDDKRPQLSDLSGSGGIEADADVVLLLYREEYYLQRSPPQKKMGQTQSDHIGAMADWTTRCAQMRNIAEIAVAKNRHGPTDVAVVRFDGVRQRFENLLPTGVSP